MFQLSTMLCDLVKRIAINTNSFLRKGLCTTNNRFEEQDEEMDLVLHI